VFEWPLKIINIDTWKTIGKYYYSSETDLPLLDDGFVDVYPIDVKEGDINREATCSGQAVFIKRVDGIYQRNTKLTPIKVLVK